jgi:hypothetical protein
MFIVIGQQCVRSGFIQLFQLADLYIPGDLEKKNLYYIGIEC